MADQQLLAAATPSAAETALARGANVNVKDAQGTPVVVLALRKDRPMLAKSLIERGADVNAKDAAGINAMMLVPTILNDVKREKLFGAIIADPQLDVNAVDNEGKSILTYVMEAVNPDEVIIDYLLENSVIVKENDIALADENYPEYRPILEAKKQRQDRAAPGGRRRKTRKLRTRRRRTMRR